MSLTGMSPAKRFSSAHEGVAVRHLLGGPGLGKVQIEVISYQYRSLMITSK